MWDQASIDATSVPTPVMASIRAKIRSIVANSAADTIFWWISAVCR
jgi:hypothetical protein